MKQPYPSQVTITCLLKTVYGLTLDREVAAFYSLSEKEARASGWKATCLYLKALYTQAQMMSLGLEPEPVPFRKSDKRGFLKDLRPYRKYLESDDPNHKRAVMTILRLAYLIYCEPKVDVTSITQPGRETDVKAMLRSFTAFASREVQPLDLDGSIEVIPRARAGPNGPSSLLSSHLDAVALTQRPELLQALQELSDLIDIKSRGSPRNKYGERPESLTEWVQRLTQWSVSNSVVKEGTRYPVSKLSFLAEGGCKTRVIAIGDLFSQAILLPLHDLLMKRLRGIDQDATFNQGKAISWLKEVTTRGGTWSFDLTTATDRFPVLLQRAVMRALFGRQIGSLWTKVMVSLRDFSYRDPKLRRTTEVQYTVGQGMGLYSSWPAFAYTHHIFLRWCASLEGISSFRDYRIIGDDVVIANEAVANRYRSMLTTLGVPISKAKSIVSVSPPYCGEVAKRLIWNGVDISPIPPELIMQVQRHVTMLPALLDEIESRYGLDNQTMSALPSLTLLYSRKRDKEKAAILLSAPLAFALGGSSALYGPKAKELTSVAEESVLAKALGPWSKIDPEVLPDIGWIQDQTRKVFILREYEKVFKEWNFFHPSQGEELPIIEVPRASPDNGKVAIESQHPFWVASTLLECRLQDLFGLRVSTLGFEDEYSLEDIGLRYCLDPTMRSYRARRQIKSNTASHLTLDVFKVLTDRKSVV